MGVVYPLNQKNSVQLEELKGGGYVGFHKGGFFP